MIKVKMFSADWCSGCKTLKNILKDKEFEYIDVEDNIELSAKVGIKQLPTLLFFKNDELVYKSIGVISADMFDEIIEKYE